MDDHAFGNPKQTGIHIPWCSGCLEDIPAGSGGRECEHCGILHCKECIEDHEEDCAIVYGQDDE